MIVRSAEGTWQTALVTKKMMTEIPPEVRKKIQEIVDLYPADCTFDKGASIVCAFTMVDRTDGTFLGYYSNKERSPCLGSACHGKLSNCPPGAEKCIVVNAHKPHLQGANKDFTLWVAQGSPFSHGVLNRNNEDEILNHAAVIDCELVGTAGALWLCKAFRHSVEDVWLPGVWNRLREEGLDGLQAFIGASILSASGECKRTTTHVGLFTYASPTILRQWYDKFKTIKKIDGSVAAHYGRDYKGNWGSLKGKKVKKPDGWGGFTEVIEPCDAKEYAAKLKEIFEGNPDNVK